MPTALSTLLSRIALAPLLALAAAATPSSAAEPTASPAAAGEPIPEAQLFERACGQCHPSSRIFLVELDPAKRRHVVEHMRARWEGGAYALPEADVERLLAYIDSRARSGEAAQPTPAPDARTLFRERCAGCHELDRIYARAREERARPAAWLHVVTRMRAKSPGWISDEEAERIVQYLRERTTPKVEPPPPVRD